MTELSFLLDLLLEHKLPKTAKDAVRARIKFVEEVVRVQPQARPIPIPANPVIAQQAPSMQAIMARNPDLVFETMARDTIDAARQMAEPKTVTVVAQTPAAAAAMASRAEAIAAAQSGKADASGRKRKF